MNFEKYFNLKYLLKYGYFDFKNKNTKEKFVFDNELEYASSSTVYKEIFNCNDLVNNIRDIEDCINIYNGKSVTEPILISAYKNNEERRIFKYPNIYDYIKLCDHLVRNKDKYIEILNSSNKSLSKGFNDKSYNQNKIERINNRIGKKYIFKTDVESFYPSIYTHSIPWMLVGKKESKKNKRDKKKYYNELDYLIQKCQYGETSGIPMGIFTSMLISEIYMCKLDKKLEKYDYVRYVDDFELAYNNEDDKKNFYKDLCKELNEVNLRVQKNKNMIETFPFEVDKDISEFYLYIKRARDIDKKMTHKKESIIIYDFIDFSMDKEKQGKKGAFKLLFTALREDYKKNTLNEAAWKSNIWKSLFNIVLMRPQISNYFLELINIIDDVSIKKRICECISDINSEIIKSVKLYIESGYSQELLAILSILYNLELWNILEIDILLDIIKKMDDFNSVIAMEIYLKGINSNIEKDDSRIKLLFETIEIKLQESGEWSDEFWLFKYQFFYKIDNNKDFEEKYKEYIYKKYSDGKEKRVFFNKKDLKEVESQIIFVKHFEKKNKELRGFFSCLMKNNVSFFIYK